MDKKAKLFEIFGTYPNASYKECIKEITNLTEPYYNKIKHVFKVKMSKEDKAVLVGKKTKGKKTKKPNKKGSKGKSSDIKGKKTLQLKVNEDLIEQSILDLYNKGKIDVTLIKCMIDYTLKIKGISEEIDEDLDMEALKEIGLSVKNDGNYRDKHSKEVY